MKNEKFSFLITNPELISKFIPESILIDIETESFATFEADRINGGYIMDPFVASICITHYDTNERQSWDIRKFKTVQK